MKRGVIDATEWIGPCHNYLMGFYKAAEYCYYPGWHEPGTVLEMIVNKPEFLQLPPDLQAIIRTAVARSNAWMLSEFESKNIAYLAKLVDEHGVKLRRFPDEALSTLRGYSQEVIDELVAADAPSKKVYEAFHKFGKQVTSWAAISEKEYYDDISA